MNINSFEGEAMEAIVRQLGCSETSQVNSVLYVIRFKLDESLEVTYVYNINSKQRYYFQRIKPYPITHGTFETEAEVLEFIKKDIKKFRNAQKSSNFGKFLEATGKVNRLTSRMEDLFLNHNVNGEDLEKFNRDLTDLLDQTERMENASIQL